MTSSFRHISDNVLTGRNFQSFLGELKLLGCPHKLLLARGASNMDNATLVSTREGGREGESGDQGGRWNQKIAHMLVSSL